MTEVAEKMTERDMRLLKKSLALGENNSNENEAMAAMLKAQEILNKYGKVLGDIKFEEDPKPANKEVVEHQATDYHKIQKWEKDLARVIANNFRCENFWRTKTVNRCGLSRMFFLGLKEDVEVATFVYAYAIDVMKYLAKKYCMDHGIFGAAATKRAKLAYLAGFVEGLQDKFRYQVQTMAIVLVKDALVVQRVDAMKIRTDTYNTRMQAIENSHAKQTGFKEGKRFDHTDTGKLKG